MKNKLLISLWRLKWLIACIFVGILYFSTIAINAENIPFTDDLALLSSLYDIHHELDWTLKIKTLFSLHNEHRLVIPRLIIIVLYYIQDQHVNVMWWIVVGNALIFPVLYLYFKSGFTNYNILFFIPVLFFALQPMHYELMYWGMASIQNIGVLVLSSLSFYVLIYTKNNLLALLIAVLAAFTSVNGLYVFIIGIILLFYKRDLYSSAIWILAGCGTAFFYWQGFSLDENTGKGFQESFHIIKFTATFISLVGGIIYTQTVPILSLVLGWLLILFFTAISYYRLILQPIEVNNRQLFFLSCLAFIFLTIAAISLGRDPGSVLVVSRYKIYSALSISLIYSLLIDYIYKYRSFFRAILFSSLLFWIVSYSRYNGQFKSHTRLLFAHFFNWKYSDILDVSPPFTANYYADHWRKLYASGQYIPPEGVEEKCKKMILQVNAKQYINTFSFIVNNVITINPIRLAFNDYYVVSKVDKKIAIYPLHTDSFYQTLFSPATAIYSASMNTSYWIQDSKGPLFIVQLN
ncbi:hypothetical protein EXU85_22580 [Spirosoma sp. KCTC 42546]|uniref:hypothetical protein n=1 Tax=Spirosoma sp. KCTC 42546 TaxID=2520506 RepID=UPI001157348A|nr:hypothetical protein [Spirosoma sp. KCTC 42546]QDK81243.1 hypothetical protein EXU85_22580 [Spirosoma sp. KCTC 42546]